MPFPPLVRAIPPKEIALSLSKPTHLSRLDFVKPSLMILAFIRNYTFNLSTTQ